MITTLLDYIDSSMDKYPFSYHYDWLTTLMGFLLFFDFFAAGFLWAYLADAKDAAFDSDEDADSQVPSVRHFLKAYT